MITSLLSTLTICGAFALSTLNPSRVVSPTGILQLDTNVYCDRFDGALDYSYTRGNIIFNTLQDINEDLGGDPSYDIYAYPYDPQGSTRQMSRAFMVCNSTSVPTWDIQESDWRFGNETSYVFGYWLWDTSNTYIESLVIQTRCINPNNVYNQDFYGGRYFVNNFAINVSCNFFNDFDDDARANFNYTYMSSDWTTQYTSGGFPYFQITINELNNFDVVDGRFNSLTISFINLSTGYDSGYDTGYSNGRGDGYADGYTNGYNDGLTGHTNFLNLMGAIADTPLIMLTGLFNFELFGINMLSVVLSLLTGLMIFGIIRKFIL